MSALSEELRTVRLWRLRLRQARLARSEERAEAEHQGLLHIFRKIDPVPVARTAAEGHDPDPESVCSCGNVSEDTYREHLIRLLDDAGLLRVPDPMRARITGEGW